MTANDLMGERSAGTAAEIGDAPRRRQRDAGEQIARRARPLGDELHIEGGIPVAGDGPMQPIGHDSGWI